ncbi:MAG: ABC transporter permease [Treponema sp.]|jgi:ribose/xylose/arabinose/galactoside ABC-type transport system permease subunit|nr:ABC transporter permease [Treponema sp.]
MGTLNINGIAGKLRNQAVWIMLAGLVLIFSLFVPNFASSGNFITILRQVSNIGILAVGMTFVLIAGGIDLSIGAMIPLTGVAAAFFMVNYALPPTAAILLALCIGLFVGLVNGVFITYTRMPPLIMTLGMGYACRGLAFIITDGYPVYGLPPSVRIIGQGYILKVVPVCVLIMILIIAIGAIIMNKTHLGRQFYAIGGNEEAARLSGINVTRIRIVAYAICGLLASVSGVVMMSRINSGQPLSGVNMEMDALIACVVGGVSVMGGEGKATGMIGGMLVMGVLANALAVAGTSDYFQQVVKGGVLAIVVAVDSLSRLRKK